MQKNDKTERDRKGESNDSPEIPDRGGRYLRRSFAKQRKSKQQHVYIVQRFPKEL